MNPQEDEKEMKVQAATQTRNELQNAGLPPLDLPPVAPPRMRRDSSGSSPRGRRNSFNPSLMLPDMALDNVSYVTDEARSTGSIDRKAHMQQSHTVTIKDSNSGMQILCEAHIVCELSKMLEAMIVSDKTRTEYQICLPDKTVAQEILVYLKTGSFDLLEVQRWNFIRILQCAKYLQLSLVLQTLSTIFLDKGGDIAKSQDFRDGKLDAANLYTCLHKAVDSDTLTTYLRHGGTRVLLSWFRTRDPDISNPATRIIKALCTNAMEDMRELENERQLFQSFASKIEAYVNQDHATTESRIELVRNAIRQHARLSIRSSRGKLPDL